MSDIDHQDSGGASAPGAVATAAATSVANLSKSPATSHAGNVESQRKAADEADEEEDDDDEDEDDEDEDEDEDDEDEIEEDHDRNSHAPDSSKQRNVKASAGGENARQHLEAAQTVSDEETSIFSPEDDAHDQELELEERMPDTAPPNDRLERSETISSGVDVRDAAGAYEHQGEVTELEEAIELAPTAPLMLDQEPQPVVSESIAESGVSVIEEDAATEHQQAQVKRSFTTNFTENTTLDDVDQEDEGAPLNSDDWPAVGDDKTFGELLDDNNRVQGDAKAQSATPVDGAQDNWGTVGDDDTFGELLGGGQGDSKAPVSQSGNEEDEAALWSAALDDELLEETEDLDPSLFFGDDDEGFLDDAALDPIPSVQAQPQSQANQSSFPSTGDVSRVLGNAHGRSSGTPQTGLYDLYGQQQQPKARPEVSNAQSFSDKAKGGYQSPYDLPMDVVKPRQRPRQSLTPAAQSSTPVPPPRTSSVSSSSGPPAISRPPMGSAPPSSTPSTQGAASSGPTAKGGDAFFADLPVTVKPRGRQSSSYVPQTQGSPATFGTPPYQQPQESMGAQYAGFSRPDRLPLLPDQPTAVPSIPSQINAGPPPNSRYSPNSANRAPANNRFSPAPPPGPAAASRYSPAPAAATNAKPGQSKRQPSVGAIQQAHAFLPRTSSPLAFQSERHHPNASSATLPSSPPQDFGLRSPGTPDRVVNSKYSPLETPGTLGPAFGSVGSPPVRSRPQSPSTVVKTARYTAHSSVPHPTSSRPTVLPPRQQYSKDLTFVPPNDDRIRDPLERWKGHPIFKWSASGTMISSFPVQTPFYSAGQGAPSIKCTPGAITLQSANSLIVLDERHSKYPGPLPARAKGKKKEVLLWMTGKIEDLTRAAESAKLDFQTDVDIKQRTEEKLVLWRIMRVFVEHDGSLDNTPKVAEEVRNILLPNIADIKQSLELSSPQATTTASLTSPSSERAAIMEMRQALLEGQRERAVWLAEEKKLWGHAMLIASTMGQETWKQIVQSFVRSQVKSVGSDARSLAALYQVFAGNAEECADELVPSSARAGFQMISKVDGSVHGNPLEGLDQWRETLGLVAGNRTPNDGQSLLALGRLLASYNRAEAAHTCYLFARSLVKHNGVDDPETHFVLLGANHTGPESALLGSDLDSIVLTEIYEWASSLSAPANAVHYAPHFQAFKLIYAQALASHGLKSKAQSYCDGIGAAVKASARGSPYYHPVLLQSVDEFSAFLSQTPQSGGQGYLTKTAMNKFSSGAASWITKSLLGDDERESAAGIGGPGGEDISGPFGKVNGDSPTISRTVSNTELYNPMAAMNGGYQAASPAQPQQYPPSGATGRYAPNHGASRYAPSVASSVSSIPEASRPQGYRSHTAGPSIQESLRSDIGSSYSPSDPGRPYSSDSRQADLQDQPYGAYGQQYPRHQQPPVAEEDEAQDAFSPPTGLGLRSGSIAEDEPFASTGGGYEPPTSGYEPPSYQPYEPEPAQASDDEAAPKPKKKSFMDDDDDDDFAQRAAQMKKAQADREADEAFKKAAEADAQRDKTKTSDKRNSGWLSGWFKKDGADGQQQQGPIRAKLGEENSFYYDENLKKWINKKGGADAAAAASAPTPPPPRAGPPSRPASTVGGPPSRVASGSMSIPMRPPTSHSMGPPGSIYSSTPPIGGGAGGGPPSGPPSRVGTPGSVMGGGGGGGVPVPAAVAALNPGLASTPPSRPSTTMSADSQLDDLLGGPSGPRKGGAAGGAKNKKKGRGYIDVMAK
jgi:hypothetical protein